MSLLKSDKIIQDKLKTATIKATELLEENGLSDWVIKINRKRGIIAETFHKEKTISYSKYFVLVANKDQFEGVTLHEVTHALLGGGKGHGAEFVELCKKLSPTPLYACHTVNIPIRKYILTCPKCGYSGGNNSDGVKYCFMCFQKDDIVQFDVKENIITVRPW